MGLTISAIFAVIVLFIATSATYNAYLLRGGKLAWSEILIAIGMIFLVLSQLFVAQFLPNPLVFQNIKISDIIFILGFVILLLASLKLRSSLK